MTDTTLTPHPQPHPDVSDTQALTVPSWPRCTVLIEPETGGTSRQRIEFSYNGQTTHSTAPTETLARANVLARAAARAAELGRPVALNVNPDSDEPLQLAVRPNGVVQSRDEDHYIEDADGLEPSEFPCTRCDTSTPLAGPCVRCFTPHPFDLPDAPEPPAASERALLELFPDAELTPEPAPPAAAPKRRPGRTLPWLLTSGAAVLVIGATVATGVILNNPAPTPETEATITRIAVTGWQSDPMWEHKSAPAMTAENQDGTRLLVASTSSVDVIDTKTGKTIATKPLKFKGAPRVYWAGDTGIVFDGRTLHLWHPSTDADTSAETWATVQLADEETLTLRGPMMFIVTKIGAQYEVLDTDGKRRGVDVPTEGAVPVAATTEQITWGTNKGIMYLTDPSGAHPTHITLTPPSDTATVQSWIGGDEKHVYVVWVDGDTKQLSVHNLKDGTAVDSATIPEDADRTPTITRDGRYVAIANRIIDAKTGHISKNSHPIVGAVGEGYLTAAPQALLQPGQKLTELTGDPITPLAITPDGALVVQTDSAVAALAPAAATKSARDR